MKTLLLVATTLALVLPASALASAGEQKTMQDPLPARLVERGLNLPKGWIELTLGADVKVSQSYWGPDGSVIDQGDDPSWTWLHTTEYATVTYGLLPRVQLHGTLPAHYLQLTNTDYGTDTSGIYLGDTRFGLQWELYRTYAPTTSVVLFANLKTPTGNEAPGSYIAGPASFSTFVVSTGTNDLDMGLGLKREVGPIALTAHLGYVQRFSGIAQYLIETQENQFQGRIKPGNRTFADVELLLQLGPVALWGRPAFMTQAATRTGTSAGGLFPASDLQEVEGSDGWYFDLDAGLVVSAGRLVDIGLGVGLPIRGEDLLFFPIEDIHPTRGVTWSGSLKLRY